MYRFLCTLLVHYCIELFKIAYYMHDMATGVLMYYNL